MTGQGRPRTSRTEHPATGSPRAACWALAVALLALAPAVRAQGVAAEGRAALEDQTPAEGRASEDAAAAGPTMQVRIAWGGACGSGKGPSPSARARSRRLAHWASKPTSRARCGWRTASSWSASEAPASTTAWTCLVDRPAGREAAGEAGRRRTTPSSRRSIEIPLSDLSGDFRNRATRRPRQPPPGPPHAGRPVAGSSGRQVAGLFAGREAAAGGRAAPLAGPPPTPSCASKAQLVSPAEISRSCGPTQRDVQADQAAGIPLEIPLPEREGVYDLILTAMHASSWPRSVRPSLNWKRTVAERKVQLWWSITARPPPPQPGRRVERRWSRSIRRIRAGGN